MNFFLSILLSLSFSACRRDEPIQTYRVSKESTPALPAAAVSTQRDIEWSVPRGWKELPASAMRVGSFSVSGANGKMADVSVIPLSGMAGGDLANINRWRGQIQLDPLSDAQLTQNSQTITPSGRSMLLIDFANHHKRLLAAIYKQGDRSWFFKMMGDDPTVENAKPAFIRFLESLRFHEKT